MCADDDDDIPETDSYTFPEPTYTFQELLKKTQKCEIPISPSRDCSLPRFAVWPLSPIRSSPFLPFKVLYDRYCEARKKKIKYMKKKIKKKKKKILKKRKNKKRLMRKNWCSISGLYLSFELIVSFFYYCMSHLCEWVSSYFNICSILSYPVLIVFSCLCYHRCSILSSESYCILSYYKAK